MGRFLRYSENGLVNKIFNRGWQEVRKVIKVIILGMNGVAVAWYGLILSEDRATRSGKVLDASWASQASYKIRKTLQNSGNKDKYITVFVIIGPLAPTSRCWALCMLGPYETWMFPWPADILSRWDGWVGCHDGFTDEDNATYTCTIPIECRTPQHCFLWRSWF